MLAPEQDHYQRVLNFEQTQRRRLGRPRLVQYLINRRYYYGDNMEPDDVNQPLGIRYVPKVIGKHVHYLFGEWENDIVDWVVTPMEDSDGQSQETASAISRAIYRVMRRANANELIMKGAFDGAIYGDSVFKIRYDPRVVGASFETVLPEYYHALWHPLDVGQTLEAVIAYNLDRQTAFQMFGTIGNQTYRQPLSLLDPGFAIVWEHWTPQSCTLVVDDQVVKDEPNPYRPIPEPDQLPLPAWIPYVHIANQALNGEYYGFGDAEPIFELQDELNMRIADFGDMINYHAHPIIILNNFFGRQEDLRAGNDLVWDFGREGSAEYLEWKGAPPAVMEYIELLMTLIFDTSSLTSVAFGRGEQSQASGNALVTQMLPIVELVRRKRASWGPRLGDLARHLLELESMSMTKERFADRYQFDPAWLADYAIAPKWAPILPRDRESVVNENVALLVNKARSVVTSLKALGTDDPEAEREKIIADLKEFAQIGLDAQKQVMDWQTDANLQLAEKQAELLPKQTTSVSLPNRSGGKNSDSAKGGSNKNS